MCFPAFIFQDTESLTAPSLLSLPLWLEWWEREIFLSDLVRISSHPAPSAHSQVISFFLRWAMPLSYARCDRDSMTKEEQTHLEKCIHLVAVHTEIKERLKIEEENENRRFPWVVRASTAQKAAAFPEFSEEHL